MSPAPAITGRPGPAGWRHRGSCRTHPDPDLWFSGENTPGQRQAAAICRDCPVARPCLAYALAVPGLHGIWGGTTPRQRTRLRNRTSATIPARPHAA